MAALQCARILQTLIAGVLDGDEADNQERVKIGISTPDFDPFILVRDDESHVVSKALKTSHERGQEPSRRISLPGMSKRPPCGTYGLCNTPIIEAVFRFWE
ncbi:hypothetical protein FRC0265_00514 [Corynebacterium diphtheriae]|nr:hypothetical protein FRC0265_00514 [Corynebacterium diphtheriae]